MQKVTRDEVYRLLQDAEEPLSTNEIARKLNVDWHTAKKRAEVLLKTRKIYCRSLNKNLTLYWYKPIFE